MRHGMVLGDLRVQEMQRAGGGRSYTIVWPDVSVDEEADAFLRTYTSPGSQRTMAYFLVDHLRWRVREGLTTRSVRFRDLQRYMGAVGAQVAFPFGQPWRVPPKRAYSASALGIAAACLKGFYVYHCAAGGVNDGLRDAFSAGRLPTKADRSRAFLGHVKSSMPANPLAPTRAARRRHPKMLPDGAKEGLLSAVSTARDAMVVAWLSDTSLRIGGLTGLHLADLHLRENAPCGECSAPHLHVCQRWNNPNGAAAKSTAEWRVVDGVVTGGDIVRVSSAMVGAYFEYMTKEYAKYATEHGMLLIQLAGPGRGEPWSADAARGMLRRAGARAELPGRIKPHAFRHTFTNAVLEASGGDSMVAKTAGNWASAEMVDQVYGHPDLHSPQFTAALHTVWGQERE